MLGVGIATKELNTLGEIILRATKFKGNILMCLAIITVATEIQRMH